ncbi:MAG: four helix bundle protein [Catalinimonas sp.]
MRDQVSLAEEAQGPTKQLALNLCKVVGRLPRTHSADVVARQLIRSASSTAANYRAVNRGRSEAEFYAALCICVEEADETCFRLEVLRDADLVAPENVAPLLSEAEPIRNLLSKSRATLKRNQKRE